MVRLKTIFPFHYLTELFHSFALEVIIQTFWNWSPVSKLGGWNNVETL